MRLPAKQRNDIRRRQRSGLPPRPERGSFRRLRRALRLLLASVCAPARLHVLQGRFFHQLSMRSEASIHFRGPRGRIGGGSRVNGSQASEQQNDRYILLHVDSPQNMNIECGTSLPRGVQNARGGGATKRPGCLILRQPSLMASMNQYGERRPSVTSSGAYRQELAGGSKT